MTANIQIPEAVYKPVGTSVGPFGATFGYNAPGDLRVSIVEPSGTQIVLVDSAQYTVTANGGDSLANGGSVLLKAGAVPAGGWSGEILVVQRETPLGQSQNLGDTTSFLPSSAERGLDILTRMAQELATQTRRAVMTAPGQRPPLLPGKVQRMNKILAFDELGDVDLRFSYTGLLQDVVAQFAASSAAITSAVAAYLAARVGGAILFGDGPPEDGDGQPGDAWVDTTERSFYPGKTVYGWGVERWAFGDPISNVGLPLPAYVSWRMANKDATAKLIPNGASVVAAPVNLLRIPTNGTDPFGVVGGNGATVTKAAANDPDGNPFAFRSISTNVSGASQLTAAVAVGTYTLTWQARSHDQAAAYTDGYLLGSDTGNKNYTGAYATFSHTFTLGSPAGNLFPIYRNTVGSAYDMDVAKIRLHAGSSDLGVDAPGGHLVFGASRDDAANPSFAGGLFGAPALAQLPAIKTFSAWTITATVKQDGDTGGTPSPAVSADLYSDLNFGSQSNLLSVRVNAAQLVSTYGRIKGIGPASIAARVKNGSQELYIDGAIVYAGTIATTPITTRNLLHQYNGAAGANPMPSGDGYGNIEMFDSFLTDNQLFRAIASIEQASSDDGNAITKPTHSLLWFGDSLTADNVQVGPGAGAIGSWAHRYMVAHPTTIGNVAAVAGTGLASATATTTLYKAGLEQSVRNQVTPVIVWCFGANDGGLMIPDPDAYYALCKAQSWDPIRATGAKLVIIGLWSQSNPAWNVAKEVFNQRLRTTPADYDGFYDPALTVVGQDATPATGVYHYDASVHMNGLGYDTISPGIHAVVDAVIAGL